MEKKLKKVKYYDRKIHKKYQNFKKIYTKNNPKNKSEKKILVLSQTNKKICRTYYELQKMDQIWIHYDFFVFN